MDTYLSQVWWWYLKNCELYRRSYRQTHTHTQTVRRTYLTKLKILGSNKSIHIDRIETSSAGGDLLHVWYTMKRDVLHCFVGFCFVTWTSLFWYICHWFTLIFLPVMVLVLCELHDCPSDSEVNLDRETILGGLYYYRNSNYKDKTVVRPSYLYDGNSFIRKTVSLYWADRLRPSDAYVRQ